MRQEERLANHTSFRIGGTAEWFAEPSTLEELIQVLRGAWERGLPVSVLSGGTNTLVPDRGVRGVVLHLGRGFQDVVEDPAAGDGHASVRCGAALSTQRLVSLAAQRGWGDLDALAGLPGRLGGAVAMNAQDIGRFVQGVRVVSWDGGLHELPRESLRFSYRDAVLAPGIVTEVQLRFPLIGVAEASGRIGGALKHRNATQDTGLPSAGCAFKNPTGASAGRLIDQAGLKGARIGDAQISSRHANFIVNLGQATSDEVLALMEYVQRRVDRIFNVHLEPEVRMIGETWHR
jgi:UDP-N-acetylmuramate dehydrogenase